ncbi:hypothetical protein Tco_0476589, partial [Tanacetum coccineum]
MSEICLPLRKRPCRTTPGPGYVVRGRMRSCIPSWMRHDMTELYLEPESTCCTG